MNVTSKISVDLTRPCVGVRVNAVQGDGNTRYVEIILLAGGKPWEPPEGVEAAIAYRQPGGTKGLYNKLADGTAAISIAGNVATVILAQQMLTAFGTVQASLVFNDSQLNRMTTFPFSVSVAFNPAAGAQKTEDYIRLQWLEDKLDEYLEKFEGLTDEAEIQRIVDAYLAANPPTVTETDPTVPAWAKQPQKPTYTAAEVGAISQGDLQEATNEALAQAKASGEFDGQDGKDGADGQDGVTPTIGDNGNWYLGDTDTGKPSRGEPGQSGADGQPGADGAPGPVGATPNIQIGTVETLAAGSPATASVTGTPENPLLNLGIPQGAPGSGGSGIAVSGATVGQTVKISAVDDDGVPTAWEPVDLPSGGVSDVKINGASIVTDGAADVPIAYNRLGAVRVNDVSNARKIFINSRTGVLSIGTASSSGIMQRSSSIGVIDPGNLDNAVKISMCDGKANAWTDAERLAALLRMGCTVDDGGAVRWTASEV